jgi:hypothetical protein
VPDPAVLGPDDDYYIIDRQHLSVALLQSEVTETFGRIIDDLSLVANFGGRCRLGAVLPQSHPTHPYRAQFRACSRPRLAAGEIECCGATSRVHAVLETKLRQRECVLWQCEKQARSALR